MADRAGADARRKLDLDATGLNIIVPTRHPFGASEPRVCARVEVHRAVADHDQDGAASGLPQFDGGG
jgi:hypothetical protein